MAYPASQQTLANSLDTASAIANKLKSFIQQMRTASAAGPTGRQGYLTLQARLSEALTSWQQISGVSGIGAYAQAQYGNGSLDIAAEFTAMRNAATALRDWINTNFPRDAGTGAVLVHTYTLAGVPTELTFTTAQTAGFRTAADAFTATVG